MTSIKDLLLQNNPAIRDVEFTDNGTPGRVKVTLETDGTMTDDDVARALFDVLPIGMKTVPSPRSRLARQGRARVAGIIYGPMYWEDLRGRRAITPPKPYTITAFRLPPESAPAAPSANDDPHAGQIYNPYTDTWSWL